MTLKELRMWHWHKMNGAVKRSLDPKRSYRYAEEDKRVADFYLSAVVALNTVVHGSVEQDIADEIATAALTNPNLAAMIVNKEFEPCPVHIGVMCPEDCKHWTKNHG